MRVRADQHSRPVRQRGEALSETDAARRATGRYVSRLSQLPNVTDAERERARQAHRLIGEAEALLHEGMTEGET